MIGAGKTTLATALAQELDVRHINRCCVFVAESLFTSNRFQCTMRK
jgi:adenylate kinase family enzyme